ncbi:MAG UNVERIFIED_CONTAM: ribosome maturation factor RimM [Rickettsiaceae bacterium]|jgi:16S rRNA processing protein RimM
MTLSQENTIIALYYKNRKQIMMSDQLIYVGVISDAYNMQGLVKITSFMNKPEDICNISTIDQNGVQYCLQLIKLDKKKVICRVNGINNRTDAEKILGTKLYISRSLLPDTEESEYYIEDLKNLDVIDDSGVKIGKINGIHNFGAGDIVEIGFCDKSVEMFSFTKENFPEITKNYVRFIK